MKQYYLVEKHEFDTIRTRNQSPKNEKERILKSKTLNKDNILKVYNKMINSELLVNNKTKKENNDNVENVSVNAKPQNYEYFLKDISNKTLGSEVLDFILQIKDIKIDEYGVLTFKQQSARVEDILRALLVKQSTVKKISNMLEALLPHVPDKFILNKKAMTIKKENGESEEEFKTPSKDDMIGAGGIAKQIFIRKPPFPKINWIHYFVSKQTLYVEF